MNLSVAFPDDYDRKRDAARKRSADLVAKGQEIGQIPAVADWKRRQRACKSFAAFCKTYGDQAFSLPWSDYHKRAAQRIEQAVTEGGLFSFAMPRGSGKTTLCHWAILWAVLTGRCKYVVLIGATERTAEKRLKNLKSTLQNNEALAADFPEAVYALKKLGRSARRAEGQKHDGRPTAIGWTQKQVIFPTIYLRPGEGCNKTENAVIAPTSGSIMEVTGITGEIRGLNHELETGEVIRPTLAICDDPQTRESAKSRQQSQDREAVIAGDVAYLAGPERPIAVVMPCTVVYRGDLADRMLTHEDHPEWQGERTKMVEAWPTNQSLWDEYARLRRESFLAGGRGKEATAFYKKNRKAMDDGGRVSWPHRYNKDELSALQHAINLKLRDAAAFQAECQNDPVDENEGRSVLTAALVASKTNNLPRGRVPKASQHLTAYVDVHKRLLYWLVAAWEEGFGGAVLDYGTYPKQQPGLYFAQSTAPACMSDAHPGTAEDAWLMAGLGVMVGQILARSFDREDGASMRVGKLLVDAKWGEKTELVKAFCRRHPQAGSVVLPAMGVGLGPTKRSFNEYRPEPGAQQGYHCRIPPPVKGDRIVMIDTNRIKSFTVARLALPVGTPGGWELFGTEPAEHKMFADHCVAERPKELKATETNVTVDQWELLPNMDNHWWDCLCGSAAAASLLGVRPAGVDAGTKRKPTSERPTAAELAGRR